MSAPETQGAPLVMTTPQLIHDLREIDHLIAALRRTQAADCNDLEDLNWLQTRRRYVLAVLASRRAQKSKKIVNLTLWRNGGTVLPDTGARVA
jgi:hypothetical protein